MCIAGQRRSGAGIQTDFEWNGNQDMTFILGNHLILKPYFFMLKKLMILSGILFIQITMNAQSIIPPDIRTGEAITKRFMELRFGLFIHWGPVTLKGTEIGWSR